MSHYTDQYDAHMDKKNKPGTCKGTDVENLGKMEKIMTNSMYKTALKTEQSNKQDEEPKQEENINKANQNFEIGVVNKLTLTAATSTQNTHKKRNIIQQVLKEQRNQLYRKITCDI